MAKMGSKMTYPVAIDSAGVCEPYRRQYNVQVCWFCGLCNSTESSIGHSARVCDRRQRQRRVERSPHGPGLCWFVHCFVFYCVLCLLVAHHRVLFSCFLSDCVVRSRNSRMRLRRLRAARRKEEAKKKEAPVIELKGKSKEDISAMSAADLKAALTQRGVDVAGLYMSCCGLCSVLCSVLCGVRFCVLFDGWLFVVHNAGLLEKSEFVEKALAFV